MRIRREGLLCGFLLLAGLTSCQKSSKNEDPPQKAVETVLSRVDDARTDLLFRYLDKDHNLKSATQISEIPEEARAKVQVIDLSLSPEARGANAEVQIFDLRQKKEDGTYAGRKVPRAELESELFSAERAAAPLPQLPVTLYAASWCGVCRKARAFLKAQGIAFTEKDVEKDPGAAREIAEKAARQGIDASGVPMFDIGGKIYGGFDEKMLLSAIRPKRNQQP